MHRTKPFLWMLTLLLLSAAGMVGGCSESGSKQPLIRIGTNYWIGYEPLYLAKSLGAFDPKAVRLVEYASNSEVIEAYRSGIIDAAGLTLDETLLLAQDGIPLRILMLLDSSDGADSVVAHEGIDTLTELKGKRIGVETSAVGIYVLTRMLEHAGLEAGDVKTIHLPSDRHEKAYTDRQVDAVITFEPVRSRLLAAGGHELFTSADIPGEIMDVLIVKPELFNRADGHLEMIVEGWFRALKYLQEHPEDAHKRMRIRQKLGEAMLVRSLKELEFPSRRENCRMLADTKSGIKGRISELNRMMREHQMLRSFVLPDSIIDSASRRLLCR